MAWYNEAETLALEMNNKLSITIPKLKNDSRIFDISQLRSIAVCRVVDTAAVTLDMGAEEEEKIVTKGRQQDQLICNIVAEYNIKFKKLATASNIDLVSLYNQYNKIQEAVCTAENI